jgi:DNA modification methylase
MDTISSLTEDTGKRSASRLGNRDVNGVTEINGDIPTGFDIPNGAHILVISKDQTYLTHGIHKFPAKFFPELPRYLIRKYSQVGATVLDPMCGSGTTVLEAMLNRRLGIGIDIDPIARLLTKVKTTPLDCGRLERTKLWVIERVRGMLEDRSHEPHVPGFPYRDCWFEPFILRELGIIREAIDMAQKSRAIEGRCCEERENIHDFLRVVFSSIIRAVSNADSHCTRTVVRKRLHKEVAEGMAASHFISALSRQTDAMVEFSGVCQTEGLPAAKVCEGTATRTGLGDETIDLAVTSPPYINAVDYPRTHQLEMYWLGLMSKGPLSDVKRHYIGTETVYKEEYANLRQSGFVTLDPLLKKIHKVDPRRSYITYRFFMDMKEQFRETLRVLKPGGHYCVAIGNNTIRGVKIGSQDILSEIAVSDEVGLTVEKRFFSGLIRHFIHIPRKERMSGEWILILKKE